MIDYFEGYKEATPYPGAPRFFKRFWKGQGGRLVIYGYASRSTYEEDEPQERFSWEQRNSFLGHCFSPLCPEGEIGFTPLDDMLIPISEEEFVAAHDQGWPQDTDPPIRMESVIHLDS